MSPSTAASQATITALLDQLTLEEQVSLLTGADFWSTQPVPRLNIGAIKVSDGPNGARGGMFKDGPTTACFPVGIALAATWNPRLVQQTGAALGMEATLKGAQVLLAPTVNLHRTVLNGRNFECYSEDPWLASEIGVAYIRGVQSVGVAATIKHFVGNESEYQRMSISSDIPERALRELYLLPFERAVKEAGVMAVMTAYNRLDATFAANHRRLVGKLLREEWGFDGVVMSDWFASMDTVESAEAGCDLEMPGPTRVRGAALVQAVEAGRVSAQAVRDCAGRILRLIDRLGRLNTRQLAPERADDVPAHRTLIRALGADAAVLLKNDANVLPLAPQAGQTVALLGRAAVVPQIMGGGSATVNAHYRIAPMAALQAQCPGVSFTHHAGADIHRYVPVVSTPMQLEFFNSTDFSGPVVHTQTVPNTEQLWIDTVHPSVTRGAFSARATLQFVADRAGDYQFSLISAGLSRAYINGALAVDAWSAWTRGDTYFTFGCNEVVHTRTLQAAEVCKITVEFSTAAPEKLDINALRFGASRVLDGADIEDAVAAAAAADVAVVFAGLNAEWDNEGLDRTSMDLPHRQNELIARVAAANPRTVVVLQTGSPVALPWITQVGAVLQAWYPGQECGNAIADVLLGRVEPGGRLPQTWPVRLQDTPAQTGPLQYPGIGGHVRYDEGVFIGYRHYEHHGIAPLFPFGHGLSYTRFEVLGMRLSSATVAPGGSVTVEVEVRNTGKRAGQVVVQLYVADAAASLSRPVRELKGFAKELLEPGLSTVLSMTLDMRSLAFFDETTSSWLAEAGAFTVSAGFSSADLRAHEILTLEADWRAVCTG
ncbi:glycoside hydrolase family 3 C-terminal domain-containing protein [uncultured Rhodoferax sp.]|uniref:glycoside hydrolase family 3 C-terminal domain-containing protein n=1 Tax=uncultured Rhodoferax sp. TaxID=223188 RepID=UPI0025D4B737|nr:glycoside hydrolase family 3 C-terminal domain-containing protein [uncultured Rhodoferax sp.]